MDEPTTPGPAAQPPRAPHPAVVADATAPDAGGGVAAVDRLSVAAAAHDRAVRDLLAAAVQALRWDGLDDQVGLSLVEHLVVDLDLSRPLARRIEAVALRLDAVPAMADCYRTGIVTFDHRGFNQHGVEVAICVRNALMHRRPPAS